MEVFRSSCAKRFVGLSFLVWLAEVLVLLRITFAAEDFGMPRNGNTSTCPTFCQPPSAWSSPDDDTVLPNCTERCTHAAYTCPDGHINIQSPKPRCSPFTACDGTNPCRYGNCSVNEESNFTCACFDGYRNNGSAVMPCYPEDTCLDSHCEQGCVNTSSGFECHCLPGFFLANDNISCTFDNSSHFVRCDTNCSHGECLNDTCHCFAGYHKSENGSCSVGDECLSNSHVCGGYASCDGNHTCECEPGYENDDGTCRVMDPCQDPAVKNSCERHGRRCRRKSNGTYECYCSLPYYAVRGIANNYSFCIPPVTPYFVYNVSLEVIGFYSADDAYATMRQLEASFYSKVFPSILNVPVLNLELKSFKRDQSAGIAYLNFYVSFGKNVSYFGALVADICAPYPYSAYEHACVLPGSVVVTDSKIDYTIIENVCDLDADASEFLCGPLARCNSSSGQYECTCIDGYRVDGYASPTKPNCIDVDECLEHPCEGPNQICVNQVGNYSCECIPCYVRNESRTGCVSLCEPNPCEHGGVCILNGVQTACSFHCHCKEEYKGPTCSEINEAVRVAQTNVAITGGILGALLGLTIILGLFTIYKILKRTGYFSFRAAKVTLT